MVITSLRAPKFVVDSIHSYGGVVMHDVINVRHAKKAVDEGADGLILVCAGAGGHAGTLSPFALVREVREFFLMGQLLYLEVYQRALRYCLHKHWVQIMLILEQGLLQPKKPMLLRAINK